MADVLQNLGLEGDQISTVVNAIRQDRDRWVDFMMRFELGLESPDPRRALQSAVTITIAYAVSGLIPLAPNILMSSVSAALYVSVAVTLVALFAFGFIKGRITGLNAWRSGIQTLSIGGVVAGVAFGIARLIG